MDFTKTCWYCGKNTMEPYNGFYACSNCGATWNEVPKIDTATVLTEHDNATGGIKYRPSKRLIRGVGKKIRRKKDAVNV